LVHVERFTCFANRQISFSEVFKNTNLQQVVRAFIDMGYMHGPVKSTFRQVGPAASQLRGAQPAQGIDEFGVQAVFNPFDYSYGGGEVENGGLVVVKLRTADS